MAKERPSAVAPEPVAAPDDPRLKEFRSAAEKLGACKHPAEYRNKCPGAKEIWAIDWAAEGAPIAELVQLLRAPAPAQRQAAITTLYRSPHAIASEAIAAAVVDASVSESDPEVRHRLTQFIAKVALRYPELRRRAYDLVKRHPELAFREDLIDSLTNDAGVRPLLLRLYDQSDGSIQGAIVRALRFAEPKQRCTIYAKAIAGKPRLPAELAFDGLAADLDDSCSSSWDAAIDWLASVEPPSEEEDEEDIEEFTLSESIGDFCRRKLSSGQRARLLKQAKRFSQGKAASDVRAEALASVLICDPKGGPAFVRKFTNDPDEGTAISARQLLERGAAKQ
ncbi:MAG: hypothetical protein H6718_07660 [Polyangiaceae bacterium]|nr:hypothetical protein [Polyangiaceae bacterium]